MIRGHEKISPAQAARIFKEWASLFPKGVFVNLVAYTDESGTDGKSEVLIVAGIVALQDEWAKFCKDWQRILNKHSAKYFHFREWADASAVIRKKRKPNSQFGKNPYKDWSQVKLDSFLLELAVAAASDNKLIVGGWVPINKLLEDQANGTAKTQASVEEVCVRNFFNSIISIISKCRPVLKRQKISVFFDHSEDKQWKRIVSDGYDLSCKKHKQFKAITIVSEGLKERVKNGDVEFLPLQAADMVAYRTRQKLEKLTNLDFFGPEWDKLDNILFGKQKSLITQSERDSNLRKIFVIPDNVTYEQAMDAIIAQSKFKHANKTK